MKLQALIVDDDPYDLERIKNEFCTVLQNFAVAPICDCYTALPANMAASDYDLYIFDIDMPDINGFELAERITKQNARAIVMFCSNHDDLVFDSFRLSTFYFLRKCELHKDITDAVQKFISLFFSSIEYYQLLQNNRTKKIPYQEIIYFESSGNNVYIKTINDEYRERRTLKSILSIIPPNMFIQPMKDHLVNVSFVSEIDGNMLILTNRAKIKISRLNLDKVRNQYLEYLVK